MHYGSDLWTALEFPAELSSVKVESVEDVIAAGTCRQGLTLVHFSAHLEPCLTHKSTLHTINTP